MVAHAKRAILPVVLALLAALLLAPAASAEVSAADPPSCLEGPQREGEVILGTPCDDVIHVPATVTAVDAGAGDDKIIAGPITAAITECPFPGCHLELGSTVFEGGPGNDVVWGDRGNDILLGNGGNDWLWGGIGDDVIDGGPGNDKLSGGFGGDHVDGESGSDFVRGDPTQDELFDSGPASDVDTLSYATGATPGFGNNQSYPDFSEHPGFPDDGANERGVFLSPALPIKENGNNGGAKNGGGVDEVGIADFERLIGSPFSDYIVGTPSTQAIFGGGGADVLIGSPGAGTALDGGADGDDCFGGGSATNCESLAEKGPVTVRDTSKVSVGAMVPSGEFAQLYLIGSDKDDKITVTAAASPSETVVFQLSGAEFDTALTAQSGCEVKSAGEAQCKLTTPLDSVLVAGLEGNDELKAEALPATTSLMLLGGNKADQLTAGNESDDTLVDGPGNDVLSGLGRDDGLVNNQGDDEVLAGDGNDLILSTVICEGDVINGGPGRDNASWAKFKEEGGTGPGIEPRLDQGLAGRPGAGGEPACSEPGETFDSLAEIEDLEGSTLADVLIGNGVENQLLGHQGADSFFSEAANDVVLANNGDDDVAINCGEGIDTAVIDIHPQFNDPVPVECETVREAAPNNYRVSVTPLKPPAPPPPPAPDVKPPRTKVTKHPAKVLWTAKRHRRVSFRFSSSEKGSSFRCKVDSKPYRSCHSPRTFNLGLGRHVVRIEAIDAAGNVDSTPAVYHFRIRQLRHR
ncbi:MAG TPA: calcium-binding protein [Solirubrobacterales bacterium]|nr:calcium-binding protein [Solirubrobacterales bacterium]